MKPRSEEDVLTRAPILVRLGEKDYSIPPLAVMRQRAWRKNLFTTLVPILESFNFQVDGKSMTAGLTAALLEFPEKLVDLVFSYSPELPADEILVNATEEQIAVAFSAIMGVAFPFLPQLATVTQLMKTASSLQSGKSTN